MLVCLFDVVLREEFPRASSVVLFDGFETEKKTLPEPNPKDQQLEFLAFTCIEKEIVANSVEKICV